jgi:hypothetical protein
VALGDISIEVANQNSAKTETIMIIESKVDFEPKSELLKSYGLETKDCLIELKRSRSNVWRLRITEPAGAVSIIHLSADTEVSASISFE